MNTQPSDVPTVYVFKSGYYVGLFHSPQMQTICIEVQRSGEAALNDHQTFSIRHALDMQLLQRAKDSRYIVIAIFTKIEEALTRSGCAPLELAEMDFITQTVNRVCP